MASQAQFNRLQRQRICRHKELRFRPSKLLSHNSSFLITQQSVYSRKPLNKTVFTKTTHQILSFTNRSSPISPYTRAFNNISTH